MQAIDLEDIKTYRPRIQSDDIRHIKDSFSHLIRKMHQTPEQVVGYPTGVWQGFNRSFGGARGELVTITAETGQGKSTFARNWLVDTINQNRTALLISLEESMSQVTECFSKMIARKDVTDFTDEDAHAVAEQYDRWPLYYLDHQGPIPERDCLRLIDYAVEEKGVKFILIDHLDYLEKMWGSRNESYVIGDTMRRLAGKAHVHDVTIVLIVHPAKLQQKGVGSREIGLDELKGSSSIKQESDAVFGLYRPDPAVAESYLRFLKIRNHRFGHNVSGRIKFGFDPKTLELWELTGELEYGG